MRAESGVGMTSDEVLQMVRERLREATEDYFRTCAEFPADGESQAYQLGILQGLELVELDLTENYSPLQ